jgi:hypothetical protein
MTVVEVHDTPSTYEEVLASEHKDKWLAAATEEMDNHARNGTYGEVMRLPPGKTATNTRFLFKIKTFSDGAVERYKA